MTDIHAPERDEQRTNSTDRDTGAAGTAPYAGSAAHGAAGAPGARAATDAGAAESAGTTPVPGGDLTSPGVGGASPRPSGSPFATYHPADYVRDVIAALALLLALALPWISGARGADRVEVVLTAALSLASLAIPYLARFGALPVTWTVRSTRKWRVWANLPLVLVALIAIVLDLFGGSGVGTGLGLALGGALVAATPRDSELGPADLDGRVHDRWRLALIVSGGIVAGCAFVSLVQTYLTDRELGPMLRAPIGFVLVIGVLWLLVGATWRRDRGARLVLLGLGVVLAVLSVFTSGGSIPGVESTHGQRFGLVLLPALAALAAAPAVRRSPFWESQGTAARQDQAGTAAPGAVDVWVRAAVRAFEVLFLVAVCAAATGIAALIAGGFDVVALLRLILSLVIAGIAAFARRSLTREAQSGHVPAVAAACATGVLGLVVVVAASGAGHGVRSVDLVMALGLPGIAAAALMVPKAVRDHFNISGVAGDGEPDRSRAWIWAPASESTPAKLPDEPVRERRQIPVDHVARDSGAQRPSGAQAWTAAGTAAGSAARPADPRSEADADRTHEVGRAAGPAPVPSGPAEERQGSRDVTAILGSADGVTGPRRDAAQDGPDEPEKPAAPDRPRKRISSTGAVRTYAGQERRTHSGEQPSASQVAQQPTAREMQNAAAGQTPGDTAVMQPVGGTQHMAPVAPRQPAWTPQIALDPSTPLADLATIVQEAPHLRPHVARNPSTYPALLDWLGALGDPEVDAALRARG